MPNNTTKEVLSSAYHHYPLCVSSARIISDSKIPSSTFQFLVVVIARRCHAVPMHAKKK